MKNKSNSAKKFLLTTFWGLMFLLFVIPSSDFGVSAEPTNNVDGDNVSSLKYAPATIPTRTPTATPTPFSCPGFPISVSTLNQLNVALGCYNKAPAGNYVVNITANIVSTGNMQVIDNSQNAKLTINGLNKIVDGNNAFSLFSILEGDVTINQLTIQNGTGTLCSVPSTTCGGGIYIGWEGALTLTQSKVNNNKAAHSGGGIHNNRGDLTISNSQINNNESSGSGGGLYNNGDDSIISQSTFKGNSAKYGGGLSLNSSNATIQESVIANNSAESGGGFSFLESDFVIDRSTISGNTATDIGGGVFGAGGVIVYPTLKIFNSTISGNSSGTNGSAIYNSANSTIELKNSTFFNNSSSAGGAGIFNFTVTNDGGFGFRSGHVVIDNSIIAESQNGDDCSGPNIWVGSANLDSDGSCGNATTASNINLGPLQDNGGSTHTHALLAGSAAIDAGDYGVCSADPVNGVDQRGISRPQGANCDIGAFEYIAPATPVPTATSTNTLIPTKTPVAAATNTPVPTKTPVATVTNTLVPTNTPVAAATNTLVPTKTPVAIPTHTTTPVNTPVATASVTALPAATATSTSTPVFTQTPISTGTPEATQTLVATAIPTEAVTRTSTPTAPSQATPTIPAQGTPDPASGDEWTIFMPFMRR